MEFFSKGLKNEFETAVVNEPSVFEPLKFYCINATKWTFHHCIHSADSCIDGGSVVGNTIDYNSGDHKLVPLFIGLSD